MKQPKYMLKGFAVILCLLITSIVNTQAQTLINGVVNSEEGIGLPYATVVVKTSDVNAKVIQSTLSDETGHFVIKMTAVGNYQLSIMMLGFTPKVQQISIVDGIPKINLGVIVLAASSHSLEEVVVKGNKPLIVQKPDRVIMNLDGSVLALGNDASNILALAPSMQLINGRYIFRGKSNVLILLNGKRLPGSTLESILASIPGDQIDRIELISSPSAKYDANASGGVIEIYTKRSKEKGWTANSGINFSQGYRSAGGINGGIRASTLKFDLVLSGNYTHRGDIERGLENRTLYSGRMLVGSMHLDNDFKNRIRQGGGSASINYHMSRKNTIGLDVDATRSMLDGPGEVKSSIIQPALTTLSNSFNNSSSETNFTSYNLFYKKDIDSLGSKLLITNNYTKYTNNRQQDFEQMVTSSLMPISKYSHSRNNANANYNIFISSLEYQKHFSPNTHLEAGLKYTNTQNKSQQLSDSLSNGNWITYVPNNLGNLGYKEQVGAGYLNMNSTVQKFTFQVGLRAEQTDYKVGVNIDSAYNNIFPNVRVDYKPFRDYTTSFSYAKNINRPSYESLIPYEIYLDNYTSRRGNAFLRPEYAHTFSWNNIYKDFGLQFSYTQTTNAISQIYLYEANKLRFVITEKNFQSRHLANATVNVPLMPFKWWHVDNTLNAYYQSLGFPNPLDNDATYEKKKWYYSISTNNIFTLGKGWTGQLYWGYNSPSFSGLFDYSAYSNLTIGVKRSFLNKKINVKLDITDVFYKSNYVEYATLIPVVTSNAIRNDTRRVRFAVAYKFGKTDLKNRQVKSSKGDDELNRLGK